MPTLGAMNLVCNARQEKQNTERSFFKIVTAAGIKKEAMNLEADL